MSVSPSRKDGNPDNEAHVPAQSSPPQAYTRLSCSYEDEQRAPGSQTPPRQRAQAAVGVVRIAGLSDRFRPQERIRRRADYLRIQKSGARMHGRFVTIIATPNGQESTRLGITASRRLGGAAVRNRAKRLIREMFRRNKPDRPGLDLVVIPKPDLLDASFDALEQDFRAILQRLRRHARNLRS
jgi:ribonuclease P protein component